MFVILSAELNDLTDAENAEVTQDLYRHLLQTPFVIRRVTGSWEGREEAGFQVFQPTSWSEDEFIQELEILAFGQFGQEAILVVQEPDGESALRFYSSEVLPVGHWHQIEPDALADHDGWTNVNGEYFITT